MRLLVSERKGKLTVTPTEQFQGRNQLLAPIGPHSLDQIPALFHPIPTLNGL